MMRKSRLAICCAAILQTGILSTGFVPFTDAKAAVITSGCAAVNQFCTLQELASPSAFINIDNVVFNNYDGDLGSASALIKVTPLDSPGSGGGSRVGLRFTPVDPNNNPWSANDQLGTNYFNDHINYDVTVLGGPLIDRASLSTTFIQHVGGGYSDPFAAGMEIGGPNVNLATTCAQADPLLGCDGKTVTASAHFAPFDTLHIGGVVTGRTTRVTAGALDIGIAALENSFTRVPEPGTMALLPLGLGFMAFLLRKKKIS